MLHVLWIYMNIQIHIIRQSSAIILRCDGLETSQMFTHSLKKKNDWLKHIYHKSLILPPDTSTPSEFTVNVLIIALWPERFWMKLPSGNFHCFMLSGEPDANV